MYKLFYDVDVASLAPHMLLEEIGAPFELVMVDRARGEQRSPDYLRLNPHGRIPTLVETGPEGELVLYEAAAICLHLCDRHPEAGFAPPVGTAARAQFYKWLVHLTNTPQAEFMVYYYAKRRWADPAVQGAVKAVAEQRLAEMFATIDREIAAGPYLLGDTLTAADFYLVMLAGWAEPMAIRPLAFPNLGPLIRRILERPAIQRVYAREGFKPPFK